MIELTSNSSMYAELPTLSLRPTPQRHISPRPSIHDPLPVVTVTATPTMAQLRTWWDAMQHDDLSVAYTDAFPATLTDFCCDVEQGTKRLLLALVDGEVGGALWLHDMVEDCDGNVVAGWVGGYALQAYRGRLNRYMWEAARKYWESMGVKHFFAAANVANRRSQAFIARGMRFHRVGIFPRFAFFNGQLTDVVLNSANRHDADFAWQCAQARAQRQWHTAHAA